MLCHRPVTQLEFEAEKEVQRYGPHPQRHLWEKYSTEDITITFVKQISQYSNAVIHKMLYKQCMQ